MDKNTNDRKKLLEQQAPLESREALADAAKPNQVDFGKNKDGYDVLPKK